MNGEYNYSNEKLMINVYCDDKEVVHVSITSKYDNTPIRFYLSSDEVVGLYNLLDSILYEL